MQAAIREEAAAEVRAARAFDLLIGRRPLASGMSRVALLEHLAEASDGAFGRDLRTMVERATIHAIARARTLGQALQFALCVEDFLQAQNESSE